MNLGPREARAVVEHELEKLNRRHDRPGTPRVLCEFERFSVERCFVENGPFLGQFSTKKLMKQNLQNHNSMLHKRCVRLEVRFTVFLVFCNRKRADLEC